ncbi:MAG: hypothetical protein WKG06_16595 [Segetibacter sp.]
MEDIGIDNKDNKWFGGIGGISKFDGISWTLYNKETEIVESASFINRNRF